MKKTFLLSLLAIAVSAAVMANPGETIAVNTGRIEHLTIAGGMNVVLVPVAESSGNITLEPNASEKLSLKVSGKSLQVSMLKRSFAAEKPTVYLYVGNLKSITVESNSQVRTVGILNAPLLDVFVDGESRVHLRSNGRIDAHPLSDAELHVKYLAGSPWAKR
jgi:hypothetical protein